MYNVRCYFLNLTSARRILFIFTISIVPYHLVIAQVEHPELERVRGFDDYKRQRRLNDREREKGLALHLEKVEMERLEYEASLQEHRQMKRTDKPLESTPAYKENIQDRERDKRKRLQEQEEFIADKKVEKRQLNRAQINKLEELGLPEDRPRFDVKKRTLYGAASPFGKAPPSTGGGGGGSNSFAPSDGGFPTPPPAQFDEFPPPPTFPGDDNFDLPPPPPPMPYDDGMGMNSPPFDEFPPPPPPPSDDFQF